MEELTPFEVVKAIHAGKIDGRKTLERWCREPMDRLVAAVAERHGQAAERQNVLAIRALRWLEMYIRSRRPDDYKNVRRATFIASLMLPAYRTLDPSPASPSAEGRFTDRPLPADSYEARSYCAPLEYVGGDWWTTTAGRSNRSG